MDSNSDISSYSSTELGDSDSEFDIRTLSSRISIEHDSLGSADSSSESEGDDYDGRDLVDSDEFEEEDPQSRRRELVREINEIKAAFPHLRL